jgi:hypothetical protein
VRGFQVEREAPGRLRFQLLVMQGAKAANAFSGRYEVLLTGTLEGKPWTLAMPGGPQALQLKQYVRVEGHVEHPPQAVVKTVQVRVTDNNGGVRATQTAQL